MRGHHAVERAAGAALLQGGGRPGCGLHDRVEAVARDAAGGLYPRRVHREGRLAGRRLQPGAGRARERRLPGAPRRRRQGRLHGQHRGRQAHRGGMRGAPRPRQPGAGRQVARRSCSTTPTSRRRCPPSWSTPCRSPARCASRSPASWFRNRRKQEFLDLLSRRRLGHQGRRSLRSRRPTWGR